MRRAYDADELDIEQTLLAVMPTVTALIGKDEFLTDATKQSLQSSAVSNNTIK